jgi:phage tail-like protein
LVLVGAVVALMIQVLGGTASAQRTPVEPIEEPSVAYHYQLEVAGLISGFFTEAYGMGSESETVEHRVVDVSGQEMVRKLPGRLRWGDIVVTRAVTSDTSIWEWREMVEDRKISSARSNGSIVMLDQTLTEVARWDFKNAWPSKVETLSQDEALLEVLTIAVESIERVN